MANLGMTPLERKLSLAVEAVLEEGLQPEHRALAMRRLSRAFAEWQDDLGHIFARALWRGDDVAGLRPRWPMEACEEFLSQEESRIEEAMVERGWDVIGDLLASRSGEGEDAPEDLLR